MNSKCCDLVAAAGKEEIGGLLDAVLNRYRQLYPQWEVSVISIEKQSY